MAGKVQYRNGKIIGSEGQVFQINEDDGLFDKKYFAVVAMCGHSSIGFFVPIIFPITAKDKESAINKIKATPRVKSEASRCVLGISEISKSEFGFLDFINTTDSFLTQKQSPDESRRVLLHNFAELIMKKQRGDELTSREKSMIKAIENKTIRFAADYSDDYVLQKAFAPILINDKIFYPKKVNMDELLYEYYKTKINILGLTNQSDEALMYCLQIFGFENEFGVRYETENNTANFVNQNGEYVSVELSEKAQNLILYYQESRLRNALNKPQKPKLAEINPENEVKIKLPSAIDKFNKRWDKSTQPQTTQDDSLLV